jgi:5-formyltetrahydrofolate cyclo-ligase
MAGCDAGAVLVDRSVLRARRRALDPAARTASATAVAARARAHLEGVRRLGAYVATRGELDPAPLVAWAHAAGIEVYLPRVAGTGLEFARHTADQPLVPGRFGIPEPPPGAARAGAAALDVVLVPLVAVDATGTRVGTGGGYYDRTFAFRLTPGAPARPRLVGLAYHWQELGHLDSQAWDVPLDLVVTDRAIVTPGASPDRAAQPDR